MRRSTFVAGATAGMLAGATSRVARAQDVGDPDFDPKSYGRYRTRGDGRLAGTLAVQLADGTQRAKNGSHVVAFPDGAYVRAWLRRSAAAIPASDAGAAFDTPPIPPALAPFTRGTTCDRDGNFYFDGLPRGVYIVRGHLNVALDQKLPTSTALDAERIHVVDYVYLWLDSQPVVVSGTQSPDVLFGIAARRDRVQRTSV